MSEVQAETVEQVANGADHQAGEEVASAEQQGEEEAKVVKPRRTPLTLDERLGELVTAQQKRVEKLRLRKLALTGELVQTDAALADAEAQLRRLETATQTPLVGAAPVTAE